MLVYNRELSTAERRILLSYLNAKYQIIGGIGVENRFNSSAGFNFHVGGIGQESSSTVALGTSAGLENRLANGRYLLAGLPSLNPITGDTNTNLPAGTILRAERIGSWIIVLVVLVIRI